MGSLANVGSKFPEFSKKAVVSLEKGKEFETITNDIHTGSNKWMVIYFYPKDFTFVCPTEIVEFDNHFSDFRVHQAWRTHEPKLTGLKHALLADTSKSLSEDLGILLEGEKVCYRATFIVDPQGIIRWVSVNDLSVGRNVNEVIRVLDALQTDELCPCNWEKGQATL